MLKLVDKDNRSDNFSAYLIPTNYYLVGNGGGGDVWNVIPDIVEILEEPGKLWILYGLIHLYVWLVSSEDSVNSITR